MHPIKVRSRSAIAVTAFFVAVTFIVLFNDVLRSPEPLKALTVKHAMTLAVLVGVMYFGHRAWPELREWRLGPGLGCALLFLAGTGMCVFMSAGRTAEVAAVKNSAARKVNADRARLETDVRKLSADREAARGLLAEALKAQAEADANMRHQCKTGPGPLCKGATATSGMVATRVEAARVAIETADDAYFRAAGRLDAMLPAQIENADLKAAAEVISKLPWVQASEEAIEATLLLLFPFGLALFTEIGAIVGFSLIFDNRSPGRRRQATVAPEGTGPGNGTTQSPATVARTEATVVAFPRHGRKPLQKAEALLLVQREIARQGAIPSQDTIADRCKVDKSTVSRWLRQWERAGLITRQQQGRCKSVALG